MKNITIDCRGFVPRSDLHKAFADALAFPDHYGNNLDALHDCLTDIKSYISPMVMAFSLRATRNN